jgi:hypothetical protein
VVFSHGVASTSSLLTGLTKVTSHLFIGRANGTRPLPPECTTATGFRFKSRVAIGAIIECVVLVTKAVSSRAFYPESMTTGNLVDPW